MVKVKKVFVALAWSIALIIEWVFDTCSKVLGSVHGSIKEVESALQTTYSELKPKAGEPNSGKV